jgi:hypothetical protein
MFSEHQCFHDRESSPCASRDPGETEASNRKPRDADQRQHEGERAEIAKGIGHIHEALGLSPAADRRIGKFRRPVLRQARAILD